MFEKSQEHKICVVVGASHAGVNFAFAMRREGWQGRIILYEASPELPYHRPPLSKTYLTDDHGMVATPLKSEESYQREKIELRLKTKVVSIDTNANEIKLNDGEVQSYDKLVLATGARPIIPQFEGLDRVTNVFPLRTLGDVEGIRKELIHNRNKRVVVIGGGYIGLEMAASLKKMGSEVTVLERENRILARVTAPEMSEFFEKLHAENGVRVLTGKDVISVENKEIGNKVICSDGTNYAADILIVGVGIRVNTELAEQAGLTIENGIKVDATAKTSDTDIYAIGDCTFHHNAIYDRYVRLESVQNAVDQAKAAAAAICGKKVTYDAIPWFWSDQYDVKWQIVGLSEGYDNKVIRKEEKEGPCFSIWYFRGQRLLSVDAINNAKAYVFGTKFIKTDQLINKIHLADASVEFNPANLTIA